jgi:hypothetical protein
MPDWSAFDRNATSLYQTAKMCGLDLVRLEPFSGGKYQLRVMNAPYFSAFPFEIWDHLAAVYGCPIERNVNYVITPAVDRAFEMDRKRQLALAV